MRTARHAIGTAALILAWLAGAWCYCGPAATAVAATSAKCARCPACPPATAPVGGPAVRGWCPIANPATVHRPDRPVAPAEATAVGGAVVIPSRPSTTTPVPPWPSPRSLFDLHCSLLG